ncbi:MAG: putative toxin-antitoxin system toxin component, PIN family [Deltaproteobacteria bacterium CG_4_8_14_3_um_filter_45_9]|nr:MAG: putative toxin-antitoxin system toxin component, PIN family [Deltaproteobacteria bacterium CG03_land_8_20_14_0_80_45_14]PIX25484.1 MAG: putative toxin-antitoxin system toxin component, PIN family [Deltaproteobacteria bacterium CG_4_8_14_3_um_filter_45_9]
MAKRIVRVFLDSNVILSGLLSDKGSPRTILDLLTLKLPFLVGSTGRFNLIEIERNLEKKMPGILSVYKRYLPKLNLKIIPLPQPEELREFSDKIANKDVPVLVSAIRSKADFVVTGDKQHFQKLKLTGDYSFKIVTPSEFIDLILPEVLEGIGKID